MVRHGTFAYTWDVIGDPDGARRIADLGMDTVTLQAAYHSVRAMTPRHPGHRVVHAEHAAAYFRLRPSRWGRLRPPAPAWGQHAEDRFGVAAEALANAGLRVEAWLVLTHSSVLGRAAPELTVHNAFGEPYPYALCPAQPEVRDYALTIVSEVCDQYDVPALMLEACGWLGFDHGSHHDKTSGADLAPGARDLLSVCLCTACARALAGRGLDVPALARDIRSAVDGGGSIDEDRLTELCAHRSEVIAELVRAARALAGTREVLLMATDDPLVTGPDVGIDLAAFGAEPDAYVLKCWDDENAAVQRMKSAASRTDTPLVANVTVLDGEPGSLAGRVSRLLAAGASEVRYYHSGLASAARLAALRETTLRETTQRETTGRGTR